MTFLLQRFPAVAPRVVLRIAWAAFAAGAVLMIVLLNGAAAATAPWVELSENRRYFVDAKGEPLFWLGTTQWNLFRDYALDDAQTILERTREHGFTFAQVMLLGTGDGVKANVNGQQPWTSLDPLTPNEGYFKNVDAVLRIARDNKVIISLTLYHQRWRKLITETNARTWAAWLGRRYRDEPNIVWSMTPEAKPEFVPVLRELADGLRQGDGGAHLITFKPDPAPYSSSFIHDEPWLDFNSMQTWKSVELIYPFVTRDYNLKPVKPVLMAEGAYEHGSEYGFDVTPLWIRRQAYYSFLAGAHHTYGHNDSWRVLPTWKEALDAPGAVQMGILRKIFEARQEWWRLVPDPTIFVSGGNTKGNVLNLAARHKDGRWLMAYLGGKATVSIDRGKLAAGKEASALWIDPRTGESLSLGSVPSEGVGEFTSPDGWEDALLILEARDEELGWRPEAAGRHLDERAQAWFDFDSRGEGATRSTCVSCHTVLPYMLARPVLRNLLGTATPSEHEAKLLAQTKMRVEHWKDLDTAAFGLFYDGSEQKKKESWGAEAVFNAAVLAFDDLSQDRASPSDATRQAFANLWATQVRAGNHEGSWDWLDFNEAPWGDREARFFGAALAAIGVGTAPGYYAPDAAAETQAGVQALREYLMRELPRQDLHNQTWALWAAAKVDGILAAAEQKHVISRLFEKQRDDGGWSLSSLGAWRRNDGTAQEAVSDGYATGLLLHVLQTAGVPKSDARVAKGLAWLKSNQTPSGAWRCASLVKKRDPEGHAGKFMSDAATAFAILALSH